MIHKHIKNAAIEIDEKNYTVILPNVVSNENAVFQEEETLDDDWMNNYYKALFRFKLNILGIKIPTGAKVLDICCGKGYLGQFLIEEGCHVTFCDLSPYQLEALRKRLNQKKYEYNVVRANVENLPFADEVFDYVVGNSFLHHFQDVPKSLAEMTRIIRTGGGLILLHEPTTYANFYESFPLSIVKDTLPKKGFVDVWQFDVCSLQELLSKLALRNFVFKGSGILHNIILNWYFITINKIGLKSRVFFKWARWISLYLLQFEHTFFQWIPSKSFPSISIFALKK